MANFSGRCLAQLSHCSISSWLWILLSRPILIGILRIINGPAICPSHRLVYSQKTINFYAVGRFPMSNDWLRPLYSFYITWHSFSRSWLQLIWLNIILRELLIYSGRKIFCLRLGLVKIWWILCCWFDVLLISALSSFYFKRVKS